jgi:hypothetical protein
MHKTLMVVTAGLLVAGHASAQDKPKTEKAAKTPKAPKDSFPVPRLFRSETPLVVTLTANFNQLKKDKNDDSPYRSATITYQGDSGKALTVPLKVKTHGIWRLKHCEIPPLRFNFAGKDTKGTVFHDVDKPKVVNTCRVNDRYEQYVLQEYQLYRIYQLLTPQSHRARLLRMTYADSATGKPDATRYAIVFEDPEQLAERLNGRLNKAKGATADDLDPEAAAVVYLFQYLIGNSDFSFNGVHNGETILRNDGRPAVPVAYDFDFSGAVNAPYATPDPKLPIRSVRERLFRGYCAFADEYPAATALFRAKKPAIYALYKDDIGKLLDERIVRETLDYYDEFYSLIKDDASAKRYVLSSCLGSR